MSTTHITIGTKIVGSDNPVFIIAEAGVNHNGDLNIAKKLIDEATAAGADAIKFQTFTAEFLATRTAEQSEYQTKNIGYQESQFDMLKRLELPRDFHPILQSYCAEKGIIFLSTPYSEPDADFLEILSVPAYKFSSGDITNIPFLKHVAKKGKPMIISTGTADLAETKQAVAAVKAEGNDQIIILHSTSNYPPSAGSLNLRVITTLWKELTDEGVVIGYSDNGSQGSIADSIAVALGACVVEKHFTLDRAMPGPDHLASLNPMEMTEMVRVIRETEVMLGSYEKKITPEEESSKNLGRRSIVSRRDLPAGTVLSAADLIMKRPGTGIPPTELESVIGKKLRVAVAADVLLQKSDFE